MTALTVCVGELRCVARVGDPAPGDAGGRYRRIGPASIDDFGTVAFSTGAALVVVAGGEHRVVASAGDRAPGGGRYRSFGEVDLAEGGLLFRARLADCPAVEGLFLRTPSGTRQVARAGDPAPDGSTRYAAFAQPSLAVTAAAPAPSTPPALALAYVARLADGRSCLIQHPAHRESIAALVSGAGLHHGTVTDFVASRLSLAVCCVVRLAADPTPVRRALVVSETTVFSGEWLCEGCRFPGLGTITRLLTPPAINAQMGILAVRLGRRSALCTRPPALTDPVVLARTGDPVPDLPGERFLSFGPPVASSSAALQTPFAVASAVRLTNGRTGLWCGVFGGQLPMTGEAFMPLLTGDVTDDPAGLTVEAFTPVKLSNDGTLLLRASLRAGGRPGAGPAGHGAARGRPDGAAGRREGLLVLGGLFDSYRT